MMAGFSWSALSILTAYLLLFFWGTAETGRVNGQTAWLMGRTIGRDRWAAFGFRLAFACSLAGPLVWLKVAGQGCGSPAYLSQHLAR